MSNHLRVALVTLLLLVCPSVITIMRYCLGAWAPLLCKLCLDGEQLQLHVLLNNISGLPSGVMFVFSSQSRNFVCLWRNKKDSLPSESYFIFVSLTTRRYPLDSDTGLGVTPKEAVLSAGVGAIVSIFYKCDLKHAVGRLSTVIKRTDTAALSGN